MKLCVIGLESVEGIPPRDQREPAAGLAAAHEQGLVHRDIKPENILLEEGVERVTVTDFGLARAVDDTSITQHGTIAGTPRYMSPEQSRGEPVDQRSDLFSLGSVLYALCTGRPPFRASTTLGVMRKICEDTPTPIREVNPDIPEWLAAIIERLMCDFRVDLGAIGRRHGTTAEALLQSAPRLSMFAADGIVRLEGEMLSVAQETRYLVRSVASAFDAYLGTSGPVYSRAV